MPITDDFRRQLARRVYFTHTAGVPRTTDLLVADVTAYVAEQVAAERLRCAGLVRGHSYLLADEIMKDPE